MIDWAVESRRLVLRKEIWESVERHIDGSFPDGIAANGDYNEHVYAQQRSYINGLRAARLAAINAVEEIMSGQGTPKPKYKDRHKPGYQAQKQREYRARKKAAK